MMPAFFVVPLLSVTEVSSISTVMIAVVVISGTDHMAEFLIMNSCVSLSLIV